MIPKHTALLGRRLVGLGAAAAALAATGSAQAQPVREGAAAALPAPPPPQRFILDDGKGGGPWQIDVALPAGPAPAGGFPALLVLDGNAYFPLVHDVLRLQTLRSAATGVQPMILVGIGYPDAQSFDEKRRQQDFTPDGGADGFLAFIADQLLPMLAAQFPLAREQTNLLGHSLGGLCTLHALFHRPGLFAHHVALSPSLWWHDRMILKEAETFIAAAQGRPAPQRLFLAVGSEEQPGHPLPDARRSAILAERAMVTGLQGLAARLNGLPGWRVEAWVMTGENHASVVPTALSSALRFLGRA